MPTDVPLTEMVDGDVAKVMVGGAGTYPLPDRAIACGEPGASLVMAKLAVRAPLAPGVKVRITVQLDAGATGVDVLQVPDLAKSDALVPPKAIAEKVRSLIPGLVIVNVCEVLVVETACAANVYDEALGLNTGPVAGVAVPLMKTL